MTTIVLLIAIYILNIIDYWQTKYAIWHFGLRVEANPIVRFLFKHNCAEIVKFIIPLVLLIWLGFIIKADKKCIWIAYFLIVFYFLLVLHNFAIFIQMGILF